MYDMSDEAAACLQEAVDTTTRRLYSYTFRIERHEGGRTVRGTAFFHLYRYTLHSLKNLISYYDLLNISRSY